MSLNCTLIIKNYRPYQVVPSDIVEIWEFVCNLNVSDKKEEELNLESIMNFLQTMRGRNGTHQQSVAEY